MKDIFANYNVISGVMGGVNLRRYIFSDDKLKVLKSLNY